MRVLNNSQLQGHRVLLREEVRALGAEGCCAAGAGGGVDAGCPRGAPGKRAHAGMWGGLGVEARLGPSTAKEAHQASVPTRAASMGGGLGARARALPKAKEALRAPSLVGWRQVRVRCGEWRGSCLAFGLTLRA